MFDIEINNQQSTMNIDKGILEARLVQTLQAEHVAGASLSVAIVTDEAIHAVNRDHLGHDYATDVISFLYSDDAPDPGSDSTAPRGAGKVIDGELVVSAETAVREARRFGWQPQDELSLYLVHGLLHLCGYDDLTEEELPLMRQREREILQIWGLTPHYEEAV
ncbi:MAG: rRNA maturation RNase YbeY [Planctomycetaceae bacterium]|nr:rRNA maturation RNase YbeY [Planctomycetaceae bacterium]